MILKFLLVTFFSLLLFLRNADARVRHVTVQGDRIVSVRTSVGIATIVQVPDRPNSVVVGDQDSFKVEYLDQAITIKPLSGGARSNLYIYTDWKRFNIELISGSEANADYVVYLLNPKEKKKFENPSNTGIAWTQFRNALKNQGVLLEIKRLGRSIAGVLLIEFEVSSSRNIQFKPEWLWLSQNGEIKVIHQLLLSSTEISPSKKIKGILQVRERDLDTNYPLRVELRSERVSYLTVIKPSSWNR